MVPPALLHYYCTPGFLYLINAATFTFARIFLKNFQVLRCFILIFPIFLWLATTTGEAQGVNIGNPPVINFPRKSHKAGTQTWDIARDRNGVMWFANNAGLLEFDGSHWRLHPLGNGTIVRSVQVGSDERIYVGGQGDFGYFEPDARGQMQYRSLKSHIPEAERQFSDVWDIVSRDEGVFFRTNNQVFRWHNNRITPLFQAGKSLFFMGAWGSRLLVQDGNLQFFVFVNDRFEPLQQPAFFRQGRISAILPAGGDTLLITTIQDGIFRYTGAGFEQWATQDDEFLKSNRIFCAGMLPDGNIALGTSLNGLVTLDHRRRIFHHLNNKSGLQNNSILSLLPLPNGSVWLGLDNGIDYADLSSAFTTFYPDGDLQGTGYTGAVFKGKIYFGTNTGLYATDWKSYYTEAERARFSRVGRADGQVWSLTPLDGQLLMGHHEGAFDIEGLSAQRISNLTGVWRFVKTDSSTAIAGHYSGLARFRKSAGRWAFDQPLEGMAESSRLLALDKSGAIWMAHPYRGIYRVVTGGGPKAVSVDFFGAAQGLPSDFGNHLFQLGERVVVTAERGVFTFDPAQQRFLPDAQFNSIFGPNTAVKYLRQDDAGNIWYATERETGILYVEAGTLDKQVRRMPIPELADKLTGGFQFVLPVDANNVFLATGQGFIHFNPAAYKPAGKDMRIVWHAMHLGGNADSLLFGGHTTPGGHLPDIVLPSRMNTLGFSFSATDYPAGEYVQYAHYLEGSAQDWSDWETKTELIFNSLPPGKYTFHVKARNQYGMESAVSSFPFRILPPWYASTLAYCFYAIALLAAGAAVIYRQQKRFEQEKQVMQERHQRREEIHQIEARRSEEAINRLQNEKLEAEVNHKNQELASATMHLVQKNELLTSVMSSLEKLRRHANSSVELNLEIGKIVKMMEHDLDMDADWEHFSANFDQVHSDFLKRLGEQYPHLSPNDYKLCAYLRINLSSKEIASLMNISLRGVEASRYRLRKRLNLDTEVNLTEFLMRF
jgi:DNA-binding CsgD family transcriptional regulator